MTAVDTTTTIPGYTAGTWDIDATHSEVAFTVRHLMVSKVRGRFTSFRGSFVTGADPLDSSVEATIDLGSIDTANADRDAHIRSADFFDVEQHTELTFTSTGVRQNGDHFVVDGDLSLRGVTKPVSLQLEVNGFQPTTPFGDSRVGFSATTEINRDDFGVSFNAPLEGGGFVLGQKIQIHLEIEAILRTS